MSSQSDEEIAQRVQAGDTESFGTLVERYEGKLTRYAKRFLLYNEEAEDIVQDVFMKAYTNIQSFDAARAFSPWIYRIAHNEFINAIKKRGKEAIPFFDPDTLFPHPVAKETADGTARTAEMRRMVEAGLAKLDVKYREPLVLYYFEEMDYREIADVLRIPVATVGVRLLRAKEALKRLMPQAQEAYA